jgi:hypothetical protein
VARGKNKNAPLLIYHKAHVLVLSKRTLNMVVLSKRTFNAHLDLSIAERAAPCGAKLGYQCVRLIHYGTFCGGHTTHTEPVETLPGQNSNWADVLTW